jgi:hypothetical protein
VTAAGRTDFRRKIRAAAWNPVFQPPRGAVPAEKSDFRLGNRISDGKTGLQTGKENSRLKNRIPDGKIEF